MKPSELEPGLGDRVSLEERTAARGTPLLTVLVPVFNEAKTIGELISRVLAVPYEKEVIVIDDGSSDGTDAALRPWAAYDAVTVLHHPANRGKGRAIRTGLERARGRFTIIQDADLEYDPREYGQLIEALRSSDCDLALGSRYMNGTCKGAGGLFRLGVSLLNVVVRLLYGVKLTDEATCYKAIRTTLLRRMDLQCERFEFCPELVAKACRMGLRIREVSISYDPRPMRGGKKIRLRDGWSAVRTLWRWRTWSECPPTGCSPPCLPSPACHASDSPAMRKRSSGVSL